MKDLFLLQPDWKTLNKEILNIYKFLGFVIILIGFTILITFVPTIKIWFKILGAIISGYGVKIFLTANHYLNK